ncbi:hypothetical protein FHW12_000315 [Dokdonella fugitiva]|uniref:Uncharacterized protein n=1 Tax=Dokdonella fugitiva TaxID=328517 RepID=A0A839F1D1_9GAMM|nr:hypothetical protein [Dokdonella fugitiva]MBA8886124.1 hypothetical protein [Dokdonella fugitiva]
MNARDWTHPENQEDYGAAESIKRAVCSAIEHHRELMRVFAGMNERTACHSRWHRDFYLRRARRIKAGAA